MDPEDIDYLTVYSVVWTVNHKAVYLFLHHLVGLCGTERIESTALSIVSQTNQVISMLQEAILKNGI